MATSLGTLFTALIAVPGDIVTHPGADRPQAKRQNRQHAICFVASLDVIKALHDEERHQQNAEDGDLVGGRHKPLKGVLRRGVKTVNPEAPRLDPRTWLPLASCAPRFTSETPARTRALDSTRSGGRFSLSPRERAGVRGKQRSKHQCACDRAPFHHRQALRSM